MSFLKYLYRIIRKFWRYGIYLEDYQVFNKLLSQKSHPLLEWKNRYICLDDKTSLTSYDTHYIYHTAWAARVLHKLLPAKHIDISSSIYFNALVSAFIPIDFYDYRPADIDLSGLTSNKTDLSALPFADDSIESLSCMHVLEHIGLGRYGDPLDPLGDQKAITELKRVLAYQGYLMIVVPVGMPKIAYNAHRIYSYEQIMTYCSDLELIEFSLLTDDSKGSQFITNADPIFVKEQSYGCGCFLFRKLQA